MVFRNKLFFSSKKSDSSSPDGSNSPRSVGSNSPIRSEKKKAKSNFKEEPSVAAKAKEDAKKKKELVDTRTHSKAKSDFLVSNAKKSASASPAVAKDVPVAVSPILASSLGLHRIKTRSGPLPQESFFNYKGEKGPSAAIGASKLSRPCFNKSNEAASSKTDLKKNAASVKFADNATKSDSVLPDTGPAKEHTPNLLLRSPLQCGESSSQAGARHDSSRVTSGGLRGSDVCTPENSYDLENPKESESPRYQALLRVTSAPRKRNPADIKSFSHELNSKGVRLFPFWKPSDNLEETLVIIRAKFDKAKEEVDSDLAVFAADLIGILEKNADTHPECQETIEDLLVLARTCAMTSPGKFWLQCEVIVQDLDDKRQELPPGMLRQLHTRMLFILTRCTRLWQFHKESLLAEDEQVFQLRQSRILHSADKKISSTAGRDGRSLNAANLLKVPSGKKAYSQELRGLNSKKEHVAEPIPHISPPADDTSKDSESPASMDRMSSWRKLPSPVGRSVQEASQSKEQNDVNADSSKLPDMRGVSVVEMAAAKLLELPPPKESHEHSYKHKHTVSWGYWGDQQRMSEESSIICRICEEEVPTLHVEDHSGICAVADRCDQIGLSVNERLLRIAETLEKIVQSFSQKDTQHVVDSLTARKASNSNGIEDFDSLSPKMSDSSYRGSEDMLDCFPETFNSGFMDDLKGLPSESCKLRLGPKSDQCMTTSSAGSMTPRSPVLTPRTSQIDLLLAGKGDYSEDADHPQMVELAEIARCVANVPLIDDRSMSYLVTFLEDLSAVVDRRKFDALTVETFGARIEKLIREKCLQLYELVDDEKVDVASTIIDEDAPMEDDVLRSLRTSPVHASKERISIDDFEIIKPISRGAFGRVFLAKKRTTGDLFAIKVLKKADMIRKNAVESILAERNILISVRNPFVVRFFYSFTCRDNLYLVMEYLNGGDLYSLLRNLGCLDEDIARVYIAEVVLALEYLHSLGVVHRDLKPDNLLIAHDGHIKLTDFGLSKVGLINSTDDLSTPAVSGTSLLGDDEPQPLAPENQLERRKKRTAVGTPDYLAPEILLGTGHGATADWWSVGIILFELFVGIPPFNAEHPQQIFDNILNRKIPWPGLPEEMSHEAHDLIDRLLTEDPHQRLGARGASEVKKHVFFKDINWDTLARQKAAFVPSSESALDTSYFTSRYTWNPSDDHDYAASELENSSDDDSLSGSSSCLSNRQDEMGDECGGEADLEYGSSVNYSFSNFSFKNLSNLASINYDLLSKGWKDSPPPNSNR